MKMNKILAGLVVAGVCGAGLTAMASSNDGGVNKTVEVKPVNVAETSKYTGGNVSISEIENYMVNKYGSNWAADLSAKNGDEWDDMLEDELEVYFGEKYDDLIDDVIERMEDKLDIDDFDDEDDYTAEEKAKKDEIIKAIESKYGANWANDLLAKNGENWDDILENELENQYGQKYDDIIEDIIDAKEHEAGLDLDNNDSDDHDDHDDFDDIDDHNDND
ncbi:Uncharacterised protein [uncultured Clostridium sp.]|uniref:hypothetical protein n=1 Tax=uncultured Clostridium sp. TaxID=59620 RepID=UPI000820C2BB|nr:hypothetical protein [uncultured Clostridium sp.]SCK02315.1 Uncharacterised protein [uncultured Clostridium sp.]